jgi:GTP-dependent phosphoenolpyruvate carboxykinase
MLSARTAVTEWRVDGSHLYLFAGTKKMGQPITDGDRRNVCKLYRLFEGFMKGHMYVIPYSMGLGF